MTVLAESLWMARDEEGGGTRAGMTRAIPGKEQWTGPGRFQGRKKPGEGVRPPPAGHSGLAGAQEASGGYMFSMTSLYFWLMTLRLSFKVGVSSSVSWDHSDSRMANFLICSTRA